MGYTTMWRSEDNLLESVFSLLHQDRWGWSSSGRVADASIR